MTTAKEIGNALKSKAAEIGLLSIEDIEEVIGALTSSPEDESPVRIPEIDPRPMRVEKVTPVSEIADRITKALEWQPIETAPRDGTHIVGYGGGVAHVTTHERFRKGSIGYAEGRQDTWWEYIERNTCFEWKPTHWMPIPSASGEASDNIRILLLSALADAERERDEARAKLFPYADATEISGISWDGKYLIGDKESIRYFHEMKNRGEQIDVYKRAFDERIAASEARATAAEDKLAEAVKALEPFAAFANLAEGFVQARAEQGGSPILPTKHFRVSDFSAAAAFLASIKGGEDAEA